MKTVTLAEVQSQLGSLIEQVAAGEEVLIMIDDCAVARLVKAQSAVSQLPSLAALRASMPMQEQSAGEFIRWLRDTDRY